MGVIYFGILLCSIAFLIAAIYISIVLNRVASVTRTFGTTLKEAERQFGYITPEIQKTLKETQKSIDEMNGNLKATDSVFDTVDNMGKTIDSLNLTYNNYKGTVNDVQFEKQKKAVVEGIKWGEAVTQILSKWKKTN